MRSGIKKRDPRRHRYRNEPPDTPAPHPLKPAADAGLKKVFAEIGTPEQRPFQPDPFQLAALAAIERSDCLVSVPTGAGKTWIAQKAMERIHKIGGQSWYASPLKALSNSKYAEFSRIFGSENVGILTGDRKENPGAPMIVGTTEILRNQLYDAMSQGATLSTDLVILDEAHFLGDQERGVVWEEVMIYLPQRISLLMLSATIGNADQIAGWLQSIRKKPCEIVQSNDRPVPLYPLFFHPSGELLPFFGQSAKGKKQRLHKKVREYLTEKPRPQLSPRGKLPPFGAMLRVLRKYNLLPAIFFLKSRADCDAALEKCLENPLPEPERKFAISDVIEQFAAQSPRIAHHRQRSHLENLAVGAHHAGQLPIWKILVENLMTQGLLDAVFATSTVAAGMNFPARTVVFFNTDRFNGKEFMPLSATEFHQMTGRAGRRGIDHIGFALAAPSKFLDIPLTADLLASPPSDVDSQIRINFSMTLNLLLSHTPEEIRNLLTRSFADYQSRRRKARFSPTADSTENLLWQDFLRHLSLLSDKGYVTENGMLTEDGIWASQLRVDQPLLIAEGLQLGLLPASDPALLAGLIAALVYDRETEDRMIRPLLPKKLISAFLSVKRGLTPLAAEMTALGFSVRPLLIKPAAAVYAWARHYPWDKLAPTAEMEEGDLAMLILRTADHLRHIRTLTQAFPETAQAAAEAVTLLLKEPVLTDDVR
ncbi:MAG: DEAD/DEAH box helicase [Desulfobacterales bacterium]|nr:DEAD/DEAH box helicase [Desulfobacterales bacterium]